MNTPSQTSEKSDPLVDGPSEVLEREGVDQSIVRRRGVRFWAGLEDLTRS